MFLFPFAGLTGAPSAGGMMLEISSLIVVLVVLWLLGFFGPRFLPSIPGGGNLVHVLLVIVVILIVLKLLGFA